MNRLTYLTRNYKSTDNGGGKARTDAEDILHGMGAVNIGLRRTFHKNKVVDFGRNLAGVLLAAARLKRGDVLVLQYPIKKFYSLICRAAHLRGAKVITLVHDLGSFRRRRITVKTEIRRLNLSDVVIAANQNTIKWLRDNGLHRSLVEQLAWDFLSASSPAPIDGEGLSVAYIGALSPARNRFLYHLPEGLRLHLYGKNGDPELIGKNTELHGFARPDDLVASAKGRFGLIWYGESTERHVGYIGEYIKYCNPHKIALYMRAGKPVIVWSGSGAAAWVEREGVGITVDSLDGLDRRLAAVTDEEYAAMRRKTLEMSQRMARGEFLRNAINESIKSLFKNET